MANELKEEKKKKKKLKPKSILSRSRKSSKSKEREKDDTADTPKHFDAGIEYRKGANYKYTDMSDGKVNITEPSTEYYTRRTSGEYTRDYEGGRYADEDQRVLVSNDSHTGDGRYTETNTSDYPTSGVQYVTGQYTESDARDKDGRRSSWISHGSGEGSRSGSVITTNYTKTSESITSSHPVSDHSRVSSHIRPETKPGSSSKDRSYKDNIPKARKNEREKADTSFERRLSNSIALEGVHDEQEKIKRQKHSERSEKKKTQPKTQSNKTNSNESKKTSKIPVKKEEEQSNIDETGQKARLLSVRRLETPEPRRKHEHTGDDSETSSTISDSDSGSDVFLPKRYILAIMMFMGFVNMYAIRVNLNVAIGAMVNNHTLIQGGVARTVVSL